MNRFKVADSDAKYLSKKILQDNKSVLLLSSANINSLKKVSSMTYREKVPGSYVTILQNIFDKKLRHDIRLKIIESNKKRRQYENKKEVLKNGRSQIAINLKTKNSLNKLKALKQYKKDKKEQSFDYVIMQLIERSKELIKLKKRKTS